MPKDAYYFKHDSNARNDPKIKALINKYGLEGYGRFWVIVEMLREASTYKLEDKIYMWEALSEQMGCPAEEVKIFMDDCINRFELFIKEDDFFYSPSLLGRMIRLDEIRQKRSRAASTRHEKTWEE